MYLSPREKELLTLLINKSVGLTLEELSEALGVSSRTLYRTIHSLNSTLKKMAVMVEKNQSGLWHVTGTVSQLQILEDYLLESHSGLSNQEREKLVTVALLSEEDYVPKDYFMAKFKISRTVLEQDLKTIEITYREFGLILEAQKGLGLKVVIDELERRILISHLLSNGINDFEFFSIVNETATSENPFFDYVSIETLTQLYQMMLEKELLQELNSSDERIKEFLIYMTVSLDRMEQHGLKEEDITSGSYTESLSFDLKELLYPFMPLHVSQESRCLELKVVQRKFEGIRNKEVMSSMDLIETSLGFNIRELISGVSKRMTINYFLDNTLYEDLYKHMRSALWRIKGKKYDDIPDSYYSLKKRYEELFEAVTEELQLVFAGLEFNDVEIMYIVLHFASVGEQLSETISARVLLVCSSGMGTSKMLKNRIQKFFPKISELRTTNVSGLQEIEAQTYDLILSTSYLKGFSHPYKVVSTLLVQEEIDVIRESLMALNQNAHQLVSEIQVKSMVEALPPVDFSLFTKKVNVANQILNQFKLEFFENEHLTLDDVLFIISNNFLQDDDKSHYLTKKLMDRAQESPVGFPNTQMGFFHATSEVVDTPRLQIIDLDKGYPIQDFNHETIEMKRMLFMVANTNKIETEVNVMGWFSEIIVEYLDEFATSDNDTLLNILQINLMNKVKEEV